MTNSMEAAALLFGSEDPVFDLFTALADTSSLASNDDFVSGGELPTSHFQQLGGNSHSHPENTSSFSAEYGPSDSNNVEKHGIQVQSSDGEVEVLAEDADLPIAQEIPSGTSGSSRYSSLVLDDVSVPLARMASPTHSKYTPLVHSHDHSPYSRGYVTLNALNPPRPIVPEEAKVPSTSTNVSSVNRPKLPNAYDPPLLPSGIPKRGARSMTSMYTPTYETSDPAISASNQSSSTAFSLSTPLNSFSATLAPSRFSQPCKIQASRGLEYSLSSNLTSHLNNCSCLHNDDVAEVTSESHYARETRSTRIKTPVPHGDEVLSRPSGFNLSDQLSMESQNHIPTVLPLSSSMKMQEHYFTALHLGPISENPTILSEDSAWHTHKEHNHQCGIENDSKFGTYKLIDTSFNPPELGNYRSDYEASVPHLRSSPSPSIMGCHSLISGAVSLHTISDETATSPVDVAWGNRLVAGTNHELHSNSVGWSEEAYRIFSEARSLDDLPNYSIADFNQKNISEISYIERSKIQGLEPMSNYLAPSGLESDCQRCPQTVQSFHSSEPPLLGSYNFSCSPKAQGPVFSFGFGGKVITCFHKADSLSTGFDVAFSSRNSTSIRVRKLTQVILGSVLRNSSTSFAGPLFSDSASQSCLARTGSTSQIKTKTYVTQYLSERIDELGLGIRYLRTGTHEVVQAESKIILMKILRLMVEHDGLLAGTSELNSAVRKALVPRLGLLGNDDSMNSSGFKVPVDPALCPPILFQTGEEIVSSTTLRVSHLDKIKEFLLRGEREHAYRYALDEKLWAHAMVISSSIDKEAWFEVVNEFIRGVLGCPESTSLYSSSPPPSNCKRENLRVVYSLLSGQGAASVQELWTQQNNQRPTLHQTLQLKQSIARTPGLVAGTLITPRLSVDVLSQWPETVAMMLYSPLSQETCAALTTLGDQLAANDRFEAAHVCYLLSPQTSHLGGPGHPTARIVLVGSRSPLCCPWFHRDLDPIIFSEIVEFSLSLAPVTKGQEMFSGIPHLQAYRFIRAISLAEVGELQQAKRYCEAILSVVNRVSPYSTMTLIEQIQELSDRISGVIETNKQFWNGATISKPSLDSIGGWLEGRFTQLVTGDSDPANAQDAAGNKYTKEFVGPFSHYSTISSTTLSASSSPPLLAEHHNMFPFRTGSGMAYPSASLSSTSPNIDRASSAIEYSRKNLVPEPQTFSTSSCASLLTSSPAGPYAECEAEDVSHQSGDAAITPKVIDISDFRPPSNGELQWYDSGGCESGSASQTAIAARSYAEDAKLADESSIVYTTGVMHSLGPSTNCLEITQEDEVDLGLGNDKPKPNRDIIEKTSTNELAKSPSDSETENVTTSGGWFSRWWKKKDGPIKANLGDESDFHFNKELGRWVSGKSKPVDPNSTGSPVPSRAQTASPGMTHCPWPSNETMSTSPAPPTRATSAINISEASSRTLIRVRSNLVPTPEVTNPLNGNNATNPASRPKSQISRKNVRSRYVDVFHQVSSNGTERSR